jgi:hypothetical protein
LTPERFITSLGTRTRSLDVLPVFQTPMASTLVPARRAGIPAVETFTSAP